MKAALEAIGTSVGINDKHQIVTVEFTKPTLREAIVHLKKLPNLENIGLRNTATSGEDLAVLKDLPGLKKLRLDSEQAFWIWDNGPRRPASAGDSLSLETESQMRLSKPLRQLRSLTTLQLGSTRVTKAGFQHLAGLSELMATFGVSNLDWDRSHPDEPQFSDDCIPALRSATHLEVASTGLRYANY